MRYAQEIERDLLDVQDAYYEAKSRVPTPAVQRYEARVRTLLAVTKVAVAATQAEAARLEAAVASNTRNTSIIPDIKREAEEALQAAERAVKEEADVEITQGVGAVFSNIAIGKSKRDTTEIAEKYLEVTRKAVEATRLIQPPRWWWS